MQYITIGTLQLVVLVYDISTTHLLNIIGTIHNEITSPRTTGNIVVSKVIGDVAITVEARLSVSLHKVCVHISHTLISKICISNISPDHQ